MKMSSNASMRLASASATAFLFLIACGDNTGTPGVDGGIDAGADASVDAMPDAPVACADASDCDDDDACTTDTCNTAGECEYAPAGDEPTCTATTCDPLTDPTDGTVSTTNGGFFPSTATYTCGAGFELGGDTTRTCAADGTWSGTAPTCEAMTFFVVRVGDGDTALEAESTAVFIEERDLSGAVVRSIPLPTEADGDNAAFTLNGTASAEGGLSRSSDGRYVTLGGYAATTGIANINSTVNRTADATPTHRVIARVAADGTVDTSTLLLNAFSGSSVRAASTADGTEFWASGNSNGNPNTGGVHYAPLGNTTATTLVSSTQNNLRHTHVFGSQLYTSAGAGTMTRGVMTVGSGLPTTAGETSTAVVSVPSPLAPNSFAVLDLDPDVAGPDTIYLAFDSSSTAETVNLQKWTSDGTTWTQAAFAPTLTGAGPLLTLGLAAWRDGDSVRIVVTTHEPMADPTSRILEIVDDGSTTNPAASVLANAAANTAFRGVARSPAAP